MVRSIASILNSFKVHSRPRFSAVCRHNIYCFVMLLGRETNRNGWLKYSPRGMIKTEIRFVLSVRHVSLNWIIKITVPFLLKVLTLCQTAAKYCTLSKSSRKASVYHNLSSYVFTAREEITYINWIHIKQNGSKISILYLDPRTTAGNYF